MGRHTKQRTKEVRFNRFMDHRTISAQEERYAYGWWEAYLNNPKLREMRAKQLKEEFDRINRWRVNHNLPPLEKKNG
jgi:hypothetical protein